LTAGGFGHKVLTRISNQLTKAAFAGQSALMERRGVSARGRKEGVRAIEQTPFLGFAKIARAILGSAGQSEPKPCLALILFWAGLV
jgi:hypothetical protein